MSTYLAGLYRLQFNLDQHSDAANILTQSAPAAWRGADWDIGIFATRNNVIADITNWGTLTLRVLPALDLRATPLITKTCSPTTSGLTLADWQSGTAQHALFQITSTESQLNSVFTTGITEVTLAIVVTGVTTETTPRTFVVGKTTLKVTDVGIGTWS